MLFGDLSEAGEGYPFEYAQDDFLRLGEPVFVSHFTKDGLFAYVFTSSGAYGFVRSEDIGFVSSEPEWTFQDNLVMITEDTYASLQNNQQSFKLLMGTVLPLKKGLKNIALLPVQTALIQLKYMF